MLLVLAFQQGSDILTSGATQFSSFQIFLIKKITPKQKTNIINQSDFSDYNSLITPLQIQN